MAKGKKSDKSSAKTETAPPPEEAEPEIEEEKIFRDVTIQIEGYRNIVKEFPEAYIYTKCSYQNQDLGESDRLQIEKMDQETDFTFKFQCNINSNKELNSLVANPVLMTVYQVPGESVSEDHLSEETVAPIKVDVVSAITLYEALTGDTVDKSALVKKGKNAKEGKKSKSGSVTKKSSKDSKKKNASKSSKTSQGSKKQPKGGAKSAPNATEVTVGVCTLDLLPLIFGKKNTFREHLLLIPVKNFLDDKMITHKYNPGVQVCVSMQEGLDYHCPRTLLNITIESIFNIPATISDDLTYEICAQIPTFCKAKVPVIVENGEVRTTPFKKEHKFWPNLPKTQFNATPYRIADDTSTVKVASDGIDMAKTLKKRGLRLQFNSLMRVLLLKEGFLALKDHVSKFQRLVFEIFGYQKPAMAGANSPKYAKYIHLMAVLDLAPLLYPGVTKIRIATELRTFQAEEALFAAGLDDSHYMPRPKPVPEVEAPATPRKADKKEKKGKKDKKDKSSKKSSKKGGGGAKAPPEALNLKDSLPNEPPAPAPLPASAKVYNEQGEPTFIVIEMELSNPFCEKTSIEDLQHQLRQMLHEVKVPNKTNFKILVSDKYYQDAIKGMVSLINQHFVMYSQKKNECTCSDLSDFVTYLRRIGAYHNLVYSMRQLAITAASKQLDTIDVKFNRNEYQKLVEEIFSGLVVHVNKVLNVMINPTVSSKPPKKPEYKKCLQPQKELLLAYAKEAEEMGRKDLAERYYLERLWHNFDDADCWFDYTIHKIECNEKEKAILCVQQALARNVAHKNSLLLNGMFLTEEKNYKQAELCLLNAIVHEARWSEAWMILYLFYEITENVGGMELCVDMALKYLDDPRTRPDYFAAMDDLAWSPRICPKTIFFRVAVFLTKMRMYSWVELALKHEIETTGIVHYLLAVVTYYQKDYAHSFEHLKRAKTFYGSNPAVVCLNGHCLVKMGKFKEAKDEYLYILESFIQPEEYLHLLHLNFALITEDRQEARKTIIIACKNQPSPYSWMRLGQIYYHLNDIMNAEECFTESIYLDNSIPECWGYLTLVNLRLWRMWDAELCYSLALKNDLKNIHLMHEISERFTELKAKILASE